MRVLFWSELFWPYIGGAERFLVSLVTALSDAGHESLVITSHHDRALPDEDEMHGVPVRRLPFRAAVTGGRPADLAALVRRVAALRRETGADLVHVNAVGPSAWFLLKTMAADKAPMLVTLQQEVLASQRQPGSLLARVLDAAQWVVGCSPSVLRQARELSPGIATRSSCIYNGVAMPEVAPRPLPPAPHVLSLGRLVPAKRVDIAVGAVAALVDEFPDVRLTIAGDGPERDRLQRLAVDLGVADRVWFTGWADPTEIPSLLGAATLVVMPSAREGLPLVAVEAGLMGRPVVASRAGGLADLIRDRETGVLVDDDAPGAWARAVASLLRDPASASAMGMRARAHVQSLVDWPAVVTAYNRLYRRIGAKDGP